MNDGLGVRMALSALILLALACTGSSGTNTQPPTPQGTVSVLVGGAVTLSDRTEALYWRDGIPVPLENTGAADAGVTAMAVSGADVYAVGWHSGLPKSGVLWKNGAMAAIQPPSPSDDSRVLLSAVAVAGSDVQIVGTVNSNSINSLATWWKNGVAVPLGGGNVLSEATSIAVKGSDVVAGGREGGAKYWKNGISFGLGSATGMASVAAVAVTDAGEVLVAGTTTNTSNVPVATLWRNGDPASLSDGVASAHALAMAVSGQDTYVAGYVQKGFLNVATYWKNGVPTALPGSKGSSTEARCIVVHGSDVYVAGQDGVHAVLWKNGTETQLSDGNLQASVTSLCLLFP